jgi:hypothetical protein
MAMITTIIIWGAFAMTALTVAYALVLALKIRRLRRQAAEDAVTVFNLTKEHEAKSREWRQHREQWQRECEKRDIAISGLNVRLAKFETWKTTPRDPQTGRFMKKGADPQIGDSQG